MVEKETYFAEYNLEWQQTASGHQKSPSSVVVAAAAVVAAAVVGDSVGPIGVGLGFLMLV